MNQLKYPSFTTDSRQMGTAVYQTLLREGTLALGTLAHDRCNRIACLTADPYLDYRVDAQSIPSLADRAQFLTRSPNQPHHEIGAGKWLGWAYVLDLEESLLPHSHAVHECALLIWSPEVLPSALSSSSKEDQASLVSLLQTNVPGCEKLTLTQLQAWIA